MALNVKAFAIAGAVFLGGVYLFVAALNLTFPGYAAPFLALLASIYPGYDAGAGLTSIGVIGMWGFVDGAIDGAILAWLYNVALRRFARPVTNTATAGAP